MSLAYVTQAVGVVGFGFFGCLFRFLEVGYEVKIMFGPLDDLKFLF